jgi:hypothetical protein
MISNLSDALTIIDEQARTIEGFRNEIVILTNKQNDILHLAGLKRYAIHEVNSHNYRVALIECNDGIYVKFDDIKEFLQTHINTHNNPCPYCNSTAGTYSTGDVCRNCHSEL